MMKRVSSRLMLALFVCLLFFTQPSILQFVPNVYASTVETRYFKNASVTVNGLSAYALATTLAGTSTYTYKSATTYYTAAPVAIDVAVRHADGTETIIISKGAQITVSQGDSYALYSNTVNAPQTSLASTDSIVVRVYCYLGTTWYLIGTATFTTERLGASSLDAATWTVYYYVSMSGTIGKNTCVYFFWDGPYPSRIENFTWSTAAVGYQLNLHVLDYDLTDSISGAYVYIQNDTGSYVQTSDANGWANWTGVSGTVYINASYYGFWVNGTFSTSVSSDTTLNIRCNLYDVYVQVLPANQQGILYTANVTVFNSTSLEANKICTALSNQTGYAYLPNLPNNTLTFTVYAKSDYSLVIANVTRTPTSDEQTLTAIVCDQNYGATLVNWEFIIVPISAILQEKLKSKNKKRLKYVGVPVNRFGNSDFLLCHSSVEFSASRKI